MSRSTCVCVFVLAGLACLNLSAQEYHFRYFGIAEGLTNLAVRQIYEDRAGFIWVSTENGIFRYDGERFEEFGPSQGIPLTTGAAFGDAPDGSLLVGGDFGLYHLSGNHFENISLAARSVNWAQGIQSDGKGHTFIGTDAGLIVLSAPSGSDRFDVRRFPDAPGTAGSGASGILVDGDTIWYGCGLKLCRIDPTGTTVMGRESGLPDRVWLAIRKDGDGNLWLRGRNAGLFMRPRGQTRFQMPDASVTSGVLTANPSVGADGRLVLGSSAGLLIRNETGWQNIDRAAGLRGTVYATFEDRQHSLWIGLAGRGLALWRGYGEWENYTSERGLPSDLVYEILPLADGSLRVATEGGLFRGTRQKSGIAWKKLAEVGDIPVHSVRSGPDGDLWIGTETHGAARIHQKTGHVEWFGEQQGLLGKASYTLRFDRQQRLWVATDTGLFVAKSPFLRFSRVDELPASRFWAIAEGTDGAVWAGGSGGLFGFVAGHWTNYTPADGLSNSEVMSLGAGPYGAIWIGYRHGGGIDRIRLRNTRPVIEKKIQRPGTGGIVYFLEPDASGRLWAGTERGVDVWDGTIWKHYDSSDGLAWDDCDLNAFAAEADGTVWIGTSGGLSRFTPLPVRPKGPPPSVVFTKLVMGKTDVSGQTKPSVGFRSSALTVRYTVLDVPRQSSAVFRYRLTPANSAWTETARRELNFAELGPGDYSLQVEAHDSDGVWTGRMAEFSFGVLTPWYRTWWFVGACGLSPLLLVVGVMRLRMLRAREREGELLRVVEERTADLRRANEDLLRLSSIDPLTGLANRRVFDQTLERECARLARTGSAVSLLILDVDHFKVLNDSEGHQRGDEYLILVAAELSLLTKRQVDVAARYGGEEFAVILPATDLSEAMRFAESARLAIACLELRHPASPVAPVITVSVGVSTATRESFSTPDLLIAAADHALYRSKRNGRNRVEATERPVAQGAEDVAVLEHA